MGDEKVKCMICGLESEYSISGNHLRIHKISLPEYQKQFPDAKIVTEEYDKRMKDLYINKPKIKEKEETKNEVKISFNFDMPPDKARVITYIATLFGIDLVKYNYFVEPYTLGGHMEFRLVTDIAIPLLKIDFEFLDVIWHNHDRPKSVRDHMLKEHGWKIVDIRGVPSNSELRKIFEEVGILK